MDELKNEHIKRQDYVDNEIFKLLNEINPTNRQIEWNIEMIGDIREMAEYWLVDKLKLSSEMDFYPFIES